MIEEGRKTAAIVDQCEFNNDLLHIPQAKELLPSNDDNSAVSLSPSKDSRVAEEGAIIGRKDNLFTNDKVLNSKGKRKLLRPYSKHYIRKNTTFINSWMTIANSDLFEECCVRLQYPSTFHNRSEKSQLKSCSFSQSEFEIPSSNVTFIRGTPCQESQTDQHNIQDEHGDLIISASSEDLEISDSEEVLEGEDLLSINGGELKTLFQSEEGPIFGKVEVASFKQIEQKNIPQHLL